MSHEPKPRQVRSRLSVRETAEAEKRQITERSNVLHSVALGDVLMSGSGWSDQDSHAEVVSKEHDEALTLSETLDEELPQGLPSATIPSRSVLQRASEHEFSPSKLLYDTFRSNPSTQKWRNAAMALVEQSPSLHPY